MPVVILFAALLVFCVLYVMWLTVSIFIMALAVVLNMIPWWIYMGAIFVFMAFLALIREPGRPGQRAAGRSSGGSSAPRQDHFASSDTYPGGYNAGPTSSPPGQYDANLL